MGDDADKASFPTRRSADLPPKRHESTREDRPREHEGPRRRRVNVRGDEERQDSASRRTQNSRSNHLRENSLPVRSEEHTSELQSQSNLVCRLLLDKKNIEH